MRERGCGRRGGTAAGKGRRGAAALVFAGLITVTVFADQSAGVPQTPLRVGTDLITVDVSVLDGDRRPVRGLTADDFVVLEDGAARPIVAFSVVDVPTRESDSAMQASSVRDRSRDVVTNDLPAEGRLVVILLDRSIPSGAPVATARAIALAAVDQLGPGDVAAVVRSGAFADNGRVQGFTADRARLLAAIESTFTGETPVALNPSPIPGDRAWAGGCDCGRCVLETLGHVVAAMSEAPRRRKVLLFIGELPLPLETLPAGRYVVRVEVAAGQAATQRDALFEVRP